MRWPRRWDAGTRPDAEAFQRPKRRVVALDMLRGLAVLGMVAFHAAWDLNHFGLIAAEPVNAPLLRRLGDGVAGLFLLISGVGLVLARTHNPDRRAAIRRLLKLGLMAAAITAVTALLFPGEAIWFGILHCIVAADLIALLLLDAPSLVIGAIALAAAAVPPVAGNLLPGTWSWAWFGLSESVPPTLDYRPVLPWLACVLGGVLVGRSSVIDRLVAWQPKDRVSGSVAAAGRHSLLVYILHQPLLFGGLLVLVTLAPGLRSSETVAMDAATARSFAASCRTTCADKGTDPSFCRSMCDCVVTSLARRQRDGGPRDSFDAASSCVAATPTR